MRYGIMNVGLECPFVLGEGVAALPFNVDVTAEDALALQEKGGVVGLLTVSDSATNALESVFTVSKFVKGCKFTSLKIHDDENGWTTYAAKYSPCGLTISIR
jgi:hypothetical protein